MRTQQLDQFIGANHPARHAGPDGAQRLFLAQDNTVRPFGCAGFRSSDGGAGQAGIGFQFAQHGGHIGPPFAVGRLGQAHAQFIGEFQLHRCANGGLLHDVSGPAVHHQPIIDLKAAIDEHAFVRYLDIVEDHECVLFVETAGKRPVVRIAVDAVVIAAQGNQSLGAHRY